MSDNEIKDENLDFPTTGTVGQDQKELEEVARKGDVNRLALVQQNRKAGLDGLTRASEGLEESIRRLPVDAMVVDEGDGVFNLNQALREVLRSLQSALTAIEASQSLEDMLIHDLAGCIKNLEQIAAANWQTGANLQVVIEVLKSKELISEDELKATWEKLIPAAVKEMQDKANQNG